MDAEGDISQGSKRRPEVRGTHVLSSAKGVRIAKENELDRGTHILSSAKGGTGQDNERKPANDGHLRAVERRRDGSGQRKKASE